MARADRGSTLLGLGALAGLVLAAAALLASGRPGSGGAAGGAAARVNGVVISQEEYRRALAAVESDRGAGADPALRRHVLDRLIDEELLVQRGLELGLARLDPRVRRDLAAAVAAAAVADGAPREPTAEELATFHAAEAVFFARGGRLHVRQVFVPEAADQAGARAAAAAARLRAGEDFATVRAALGGPEPAPVPDAALPVAKLADYLGPTPLRTALALAPGAVSDPIRSAGGWSVLVLVAREGAIAPPLAEIRDEVRAEWLRRRDERALRAALDDLRARATIDLDTP